MSDGKQYCKETYSSLEDFFPFYMTQHRSKICRILHATGTSLGIIIWFIALIIGSFKLIPLGLVVGYAFAWTGHFIFEKNRPATFKFPVYSFLSDFKMCKLVLTGQADEYYKRLGISQLD